LNQKIITFIIQVPPGLYDKNGKSINKGSLYISESSSPQVSKAYFDQFQEDFSLFLRSRSKEVLAGGRMVLILLGRRDRSHVDRGNSFLWELLSRSFATLVSQVYLYISVYKINIMLRISFHGCLYICICREKLSKKRLMGMILTFTHLQGMN